MNKNVVKKWNYSRFFLIFIFCNSKNLVSFKRENLVPSDYLVTRQSLLSGLPWLHINVWTYSDGFFLALFSVKCRKVITHKCFKHLCVTTPKCWNEPIRDGGETEWKTESMENLRQPFCPYKCRKVIPVFRVSERWYRPLWKMGKMAVAPQNIS